ncbi:MAG: hypothetical protein ACYC2E_04090 [Sulfuricella sp.]
MQINPHLHHAKLPGWQLTREQRSAIDGNGCLVTLIANVDVREMMFFINLKKHRNDNAVKHADGWLRASVYDKLSQYN